jgi:hypothetical protein
MSDENPASKAAILDLICSMERARAAHKPDFSTLDDNLLAGFQLHEAICDLCDKYVLEHDLPFPDIMNSLLSVVAEGLVHHFYTPTNDILPVSLAVAETAKIIMEKVGTGVAIERNKQEGRNP